MKKLTIGALIAVGFFASDVAANRPTYRQALNYRNAENFCNGFHAKVCTGGDANIPPEGFPDLCNTENCIKHVEENRCLPKCLHSCDTKEACSECFLCQGDGEEEAPERRRRQDNNNHNGGNNNHNGGNNNHNGGNNNKRPPLPPGPPPPVDGDFCGDLQELCTADEGANRRRRQEGNNNNHDLCNLDECDQFLAEKPCFPHCVNNCGEGDEKCIDDCFTHECPEENARRRLRNGARLANRKKQGPPPAWTEEEVQEYCGMIQTEVCAAGHPEGNNNGNHNGNHNANGNNNANHNANNNNGNHNGNNNANAAEGNENNSNEGNNNNGGNNANNNHNGNNHNGNHNGGEHPNLCDEPTCVDFIGHHNCFDDCVSKCQDDACVDHCFTCQDGKPPGPPSGPPQRRRNAQRRGAQRRGGVQRRAVVSRQAVNRFHN